MTLIGHKHSAVIATLLAMAAMLSCGNKPEGRDVAARVGSVSLTDAEIAQVIPSGLSQEDSLERVNQYVDSWISNRIVSEVAAKNIRNGEEIERMVDDYRRQLIMMEYRRQMVSRDTALAVTSALIQDYYEAHSAEMKLREPMVKGVFVAMSAQSPLLRSVRKLYQSEKADDIEKLEKITLTEAMGYDYFRDRWLPWSQVADKLPGKPVMPAKGAHIELTEDGITYLLYVTQTLGAGERMPLEAAEPHIRRTLEGLRQVELDRRLRNELYQKSLKSGKVWRR